MPVMASPAVKVSAVASQELSGSPLPTAKPTAPRSAVKGQPSPWDASFHNVHDSLMSLGHPATLSSSSNEAAADYTGFNSSIISSGGAGRLSTQSDGTVSGSYPLGVIVAKGFVMPLTAMYDSGDGEDDYGLGKGWRLNLPVLVNDVAYKHKNGASVFFPRPTIYYGNGQSDMVFQPTGEYGINALEPTTTSPTNNRRYETDYCSFDVDVKNEQQKHCSVHYGDGKSHSWNYRVIDRETGLVYYLSSKHLPWPETDDDQSDDDAYSAEYSPGGQYAKLVYYTFLVTNSSTNVGQSGSETDPTWNSNITLNGGSYIEFNYAPDYQQDSEIFKKFKAQGTDYNAPDVYFYYTLASIVPDTTTEDSPAFTGTTQNDSNSITSCDMTYSDTNQTFNYKATKSDCTGINYFAWTLHTPTSRNITFYTRNIEIPGDKSNAKGYSYQEPKDQGYRIYPDRVLLEIYDQDVTNASAVKSYKTTFKYHWYQNDHTTNDDHIDLDGNGGLILPDFSWGDSSIASATYPDGETDTFNYFSALVHSSSGNPSATIEGVPVCIGDAYGGTNGISGCSFFSDSNGNDSAHFSAIPFVQSVTRTSADGSTTIVTPAVSPSANGGSNPVTAFTNGKRTLFMDSYGFPAIDPNSDKGSKIFPNFIFPTGWAAYSSGKPSDYAKDLANAYGESGLVWQHDGTCPQGANYCYARAASDAYTNDNTYTVYTLPGTPFYTDAFLDHSDEQRNSYSYGNMTIATDSNGDSFYNPIYADPSQNLTTQQQSYDSPTSTVSRTLNSYVSADKQGELKTQTTYTYTSYGYVRTQVNPDGSENVYYYTNDDTDTTAPDPQFSHVTASISIPNAANNNDPEKGDMTQSPNNVYYTYYEINNAHNLVDAQVSGYINCTATDSGLDGNLCEIGKNTADISASPTDYTSPLYQAIRARAYYNNAQASPTLKGVIARTSYQYDGYGRLIESSYQPHPTSTAAFASPAIDTTYKYLTSIDQLSSQGIDGSALLATTAVSSPSPANWYVVKTVKTNGQSATTNGNYYLSAQHTIKTLKVVNQLSGQTLASYAGYDADSQTFKRSKFIRYDGLGIPRSVIEPNIDRAITTDYWTGNAKDQFGGQISSGTLMAKESFYCENAAATNLDTLLQDPSTNCQAVNGSERVMNSLGQLSNSTLLQASDTSGEKWQTLSEQVYVYNNAVDPKMLESITSYGMGGKSGQKLSVAKPLYNSSHQQIGTLTTATTPNGYVPTDANGNFKASSTALSLTLTDNVLNRRFNVSAYPCSSNDGNGKYCVRYLRVSQLELNTVGNGDGNDLDVTKVYSPGASRTSWTATYRGYNSSSQDATDGGAPVFNGDDLTTLEYAPGGSDTTALQQTLNGLIDQFNMAISNQSATFSEVSRTSLWYDQYNRPVLASTAMYNKGTLQKQIEHRKFYNNDGLVTRVTNAETGNLIANKGMSADGKDARDTNFYYNDENTLISVVMSHNVNGDTTAALSGDDQTPSATFLRQKDFVLDALGHRISETVCGYSKAPATHTMCTAISGADVRKKVSNITYDDLWRPIESTDANGSKHHAYYYATGQLQATADELGTTQSGNAAPTLAKPVCYVYDMAHNLAVGIYNGQTGSTDVGSICSVSSQSSLSSISASQAEAMDLIRYYYMFGTNQLQVVKYPDSKILSYSYLDDNGNLTSQLHQIQDIGNWTTNITNYFYAGLLASITWKDSSGATQTTLTRNYDSHNLPILTSLTDAASKQVATISTARSYGNENVTSTRSWSYPVKDSSGNYQQQTASFSKQHNYLGFLTNYTRQVGSDQAARTFSFDALRRLTSSTNSAASNTSASYQYDIGGNTVSSTASTGSARSYNGLDEDSSNTYDANGNSIKNSQGCFAYDTEDRMVKYTALGSDGQCDGKVYTFSYYPTGMRQLATDGANSLTYYWNGMSAINVVDNQGQISHWLGREVRGLTDSTGKQVQALQYLISDLNGSVLGSFNDSTLGRYDDYGRLQASVTDLLATPSGTPAANPLDITKIPYGFDGVLVDPELNGLHFPAREALLSQTTTPRFLQTDPVDQNFNPYKFMDNNPIDLVDPLGMKTHNSKKWRTKHGYYAGGLVTPFIQIHDGIKHPHHDRQIFSEFDAQGYKNKEESEKSADEIFGWVMDAYLVGSLGAGLVSAAYLGSSYAYDYFFGEEAEATESATDIPTGESKSFTRNPGDSNEMLVEKPNSEEFISENDTDDSEIGNGPLPNPEDVPQIEVAPRPFLKQTPFVGFGGILDSLFENDPLHIGPQPLAPYEEVEGNYITIYDDAEFLKITGESRDEYISRISRMSDDMNDWELDENKDNSLLRRSDEYAHETRLTTRYGYEAYDGMEAQRNELKALFNWGLMVIQ